MIKSKAQHRRFKELVEKGEMKKEVFDKLIKDTPNLAKLPERISVDNQHVVKISQVKSSRVR